VQAQVILDDGTPVVGAEVSFECDSPKYAFVQTTGPDGGFIYGSKMMAGGAPAGIYRVKIIPSRDALIAPRAIPEKYGTFSSSGLEFVCEPRRNHVQLVLDSVTEAGQQLK
jgi:hypothetical protein